MKKIITTILVIAMLLSVAVFVGCPLDNGEYQITSVAVSPATLVMNINGTQQLIATVIATEGANQAVTWTSSNNAVAAVDANGLVTAHTIGSTTITVRSQVDNSKYATATITVSETPITPEIYSVSVSPASATINPGGTQQLAATVIALGGASQAVTWTSSNNAVAAVDASGLVTAVALGSTTITVRSVFDNSKYAAATITVATLSAGNINTMTARQILEHIYANVQPSAYIEEHSPDSPWMMVFTQAQVIDRGISWFLGVNGVPFSDISAIEPAVGFGFSLVVVRLNTGVNYQQWANTIYNNLDADKWVCVAADAVRVERIGNVLLALIADMPYINHLVAAFNTLR